MEISMSWLWQPEGSSGALSRGRIAGNDGNGVLWMDEGVREKTGVFWWKKLNQWKKV